MLAGLLLSSLANRLDFLSLRELCLWVDVTFAELVACMIVRA